MNKKIWKQLDSRWASKPYPTKASSFGGNGCGCCSCTHIAMEQDKYANWTPEKLRPWMVKQGYAYVNQGTTWNGITETLKHIGHKSVIKVWDDPMSVAWSELNKGNRIGIILFAKGYGGSKKVYWTAGGHYVAFTGYKMKDGKHYFFCKDSGGRNHDGWYNYEDHMQGVVSKVWIVERLAEEKKSNADKLVSKATEIAWACGTPSKKWLYETGAPTPKCKTAMKARGYDTRIEYSDCGYFMNTIIYHALTRKVRVLGGVKDPFPSVSGFKVVYSGTSVKQSQLKPGDIVRYKNANRNTQHTLMYMGGGKIAEAGRGTRFGVIRKSTKYTGTKKKIEILRATEE